MGSILSAILQFCNPAIPSEAPMNRHGRTVNVVGVLVVMIGTFAILRAQQAAPDLILTNGKIVTVDERFTIAQGNGLEKLFQGNGFFLIHRARVGLIDLADPHGIHNDEVLLDPRVGRYGSKRMFIHDAHAAPLHLFEETP